jgi:hypothetical protein
VGCIRSEGQPTPSLAPSEIPGRERAAGSCTPIPSLGCRPRLFDQRPAPRTTVGAGGGGRRRQPRSTSPGPRLALASRLARRPSCRDRPGPSRRDPPTVDEMAATTTGHDPPHLTTSRIPVLSLSRSA